MKIYDVVKTESLMLKKISCDCCKKEFIPVINETEIQEFLSIEKTNGYGSIFGDETFLKCDLCQECVKKLISKYSTIFYKDDLA
jgi:hypothetical protein